MKGKTVYCPIEMLELITAVIEEAAEKQGLKLSLTQALQIIANGYKNK